MPIQRLNASLLAIAVVFVACTAVTPQPASAAAASCPLYEFIGARGSGEKSIDYNKPPTFGMGNEVSTAYAKFASAYPDGQVTAYGVHYPAVSIWNGFKDISAMLNGAGAVLHLSHLGAYTDSVRAGTADIQKHIEARHKTCPGTRFVLSGYSQGAQAAGDALQRMPSKDQNLIAGAAFFGDPYFNADSWSGRSHFDPTFYGIFGPRPEWPNRLHGDIFSYCHRYDPICNISNRYHIIGDGDVYVRNVKHIEKSQHENYVPSGDAEDAGLQLAIALHAPDLPKADTAPLDLVFAIDSTGSMGPEIDGVKTNVAALANTIASTSSNFRFALVDYKDDPANDSPYQARVDVGFTSSTSQFANGLADLAASGGGDNPESVYSGIMTALNLPWRNGVRKAVIAIGDAPGKDPEPVTGFTLDTVHAKALAVDPAQVYAVSVGSDTSATSFFTAISDSTGGKTLTSPDTSTFVATLKSAIVAVGTAPQAALSSDRYDGLIGEPISLSAAGSRDTAEPIVSYDWDFDGDGTYDQTTTDPGLRHTYHATGTYHLVVRARSASGLTGTATATVHVTAAPKTAPGTVRGLTATPGDQTVELAWRPGPGVQPQYYTIRDTKGDIVDRIAVGTGSATVRWRDSNLTNGTTYAYTVSAGNERGDGPSAGPVSATPGTSSPSPSATSPTPSPSASHSHKPSPAPSGTPSSPSTVAGGLPTTGSNTLPVVAFGLALLIIGAALMIALRARRRDKIKTSNVGA